MNNLLVNAPLYYPSAREWMWNYCIYLGPFTDSKGANYDLGCLLNNDNSISNATVYGNNLGDYNSGCIHPTMYFSNEVSNEVLRRVKQLNLLKQIY
jgi:hypothetical protein